jgi:hypothetical protein
MTTKTVQISQKQAIFLARLDSEVVAAQARLSVAFETILLGEGDIAPDTRLVSVDTDKGEMTVQIAVPVLPIEEG